MPASQRRSSRTPPGTPAAGSAGRSAKPSGRKPAGDFPLDDPAVEARSASKRLFDLRWLIAAMFVVYGVVLIIVGILDDKAEVEKAAGVRINLWAGIGMLLLGLFFAAWARWKPLRHE